MKRLLSVMIGVGLLLGTASFAFSQEQKEEQKTKKKGGKKGGKKKDAEKKAPTA